MSEIQQPQPSVDRAEIVEAVNAFLLNADTNVLQEFGAEHRDDAATRAAFAAEVEQRIVRYMEFASAANRASVPVLRVELRATTKAKLVAQGYGRKLAAFSQAPSMGRERLEKILDGDSLHSFTRQELYGKSERPVPNQNFAHAPGEQFFIFKMFETEQYLINTEGYSYCRYVIRIVEGR